LIKEKKLRFDLSKYSTVAERLAKFHTDYPDGRIITEVTSMEGELNKTRWVIKATIFLSAGDQAVGLAKATGHAFEVDGSGGANATSALENGESSAIGRSLMVMGYSMSKDNLASAEEMQKVIRGQGRDYLSEADKLTDVTQLRLMWAEAKSAGVHPEVLSRIKERADEVSSSSSVGTGAEGSVPILIGEDALIPATGENPGSRNPKGRK